MTKEYLVSFNDEEKSKAKILLATQVVKMMGRKFEEGDWSTVYCGAKGIPESEWSNLHIDINHNGLGVEHKMKCEKPKRSLLEVCGTTLMHPSATRSIRIESTEIDANEAMHDVLNQYAELIHYRTERVRAASPSNTSDMRTGWLLWERSLTEFIYFEERMLIPDPNLFYAQWNEKERNGARKSSKNLWIYEKETHKKRYSVTTSAGAKIQPYFDVPSPTSVALNYFRVQGEELTSGRILIWLSTSTARELKRLLGDNLDADTLSEAIFRSSTYFEEHERDAASTGDLAIPLEITKPAYEVLVETWRGISDEHRAQLLIQTLRNL
jgi:hypothetical protein